MKMLPSCTQASVRQAFSLERSEIDSEYGINGSSLVNLHAHLTYTKLMGCGPGWVVVGNLIPIYKRMTAANKENSVGNEVEYIKSAGCKVEDSRATTPSFVAGSGFWCNLSRHPYSNWTQIERALSPRSRFSSKSHRRFPSYGERIWGTRRFNFSKGRNYPSFPVVKERK